MLGIMGVLLIIVVGLLGIVIKEKCINKDNKLS